MRHAILGCLVCAALMPAGTLHSQIIRGRIIDQISNQPGAGVLVLLLEQDTVVRAYTHSRAGGEFELVAPAPGRYGISTRLVGYTRSKEQGAGSREQGAGSREQGAGSKEQGARSKEQGARSRARYA